MRTGIRRCNHYLSFKELQREPYCGISGQHTLSSQESQTMVAQVSRLQSTAAHLEFLPGLADKFLGRWAVHQHWPCIHLPARQGW